MVLRLLVFSDSNISIAFKSQGHVAWLGFVVSAQLKMISFSDNLMYLLTFLELKL